MSITYKVKSKDELPAHKGSKVYFSVKEGEKNTMPEEISEKKTKKAKK